MSNGRWQIDEQLLQLGIGKSATQRVKAYESMWVNRCYSNGLPDELPPLLEKTQRAPSWRKIAICILKNDLKLRGLGYTEAGYDANLIKSIEKANNVSETQLTLGI